MVWFSIAGVRAYYRGDVALIREDFRGAAEYVVSHAKPGDVLICYVPKGRFAYEYYAGSFAPELEKPKIVFPRHGDAANYADFLDDLPTVRFVQSTMQQHHRVWLLLTHNTDNGREDRTTGVLRSTIGQQWSMADGHNFPGIRVSLYAREQQAR